MLVTPCGIVTLTRLSSLQNIYSGIAVTPCGISTVAQPNGTASRVEPL